MENTKLMTQPAELITKQALKGQNEMNGENFRKIEIKITQNIKITMCNQFYSKEDSGCIFEMTISNGKDLIPKTEIRHEEKKL